MQSTYSVARRQSISLIWVNINPVTVISVYGFRLLIECGRLFVDFVDFSKKVIFAFCLRKKIIK